MANVEIDVTINKGITKAPVYEENPFITAMMGEVKIKHKTQTLKSSNRDTEIMLVNQDSEVMGHSAFMRRVEVDEDKFAKVYISQLAALWDLKKPSIKVLSYVLTILKPNDDKVLFDIKDCMKYCGLTSKQTVYNGLISLINASIIARTKYNNFYYINPSIVFNGSRVTFITTYTKKQKSKAMENPNQLKLSIPQD